MQPQLPVQSVRPTQTIQQFQQFQQIQQIPQIPQIQKVGSINGGDRYCTIYFEISDAEASHVIGKAGAFQQAIKQQTGAKVQLSKRGEYIPGTENRQVAISGPMQAVHAAHKMVLERAEEVLRQSQV